MVSERVAYAALLVVMIVGTAFILYGMFLSAGQSLNAPAIIGGVILLAGIAMMTAVTVSSLDMQETPTHGQE